MVAKLNIKLLKKDNIIVDNIKPAKSISKICLEYAIAVCQF